MPIRSRAHANRGRHGGSAGKRRVRATRRDDGSGDEAVVQPYRSMEGMDTYIVANDGIVILRALLPLGR
jgi:hypothetical protein